MKTSEIQGLLKVNPFYEGMSDEHVEFVSGCASIVQFRSGDLLARAGEDAHYFCLLRDGLADIEVTTRAGTYTVQTIGRGSLIGWSWLVPPHFWRYDVRAREDVSAFSFDAGCVRSKFDQDPTFGLAMYKRMTRIIVERLVATRVQLSDFYT